MKVGFIGLGIMGKPMASHLAEAGVDLLVSDLNQDLVKELEGKGAKGADYETIGKECDIVAMILPTAAIVKDVIFGENGIAQYMKKGSLVIDHSSVTATDSRECYDRLHEMGIGFLDAPVSGGQEGAVKGSLAIMVGGDEKDFDLAKKELFQHYGKSALLIGGPGSGSITKLANQIIVNNNIAVLAEALTFATKAGADPEKVFQAIRGGLAGSQVMEDKAPRMVSRNFVAGGTIKVNHKDITNVINTAHAIDCPIPFTAQLYEIQQALKVHGHLMEDHAAYVKYFENLADVTVQSPEDQEAK